MHIRLLSSTFRMDANRSERDSTGMSAALLPKLLPRCRDRGGGKPNGVVPAPGEIKGSNGPMPGDCEGVTIGDEPLRRGELRREGKLDMETPIDERWDVMAAKPAGSAINACKSIDNQKEHQLKHMKPFSTAAHWQHPRLDLCRFLLACQPYRRDPTFWTH